MYLVTRVQMLNHLLIEIWINKAQGRDLAMRFTPTFVNILNWRFFKIFFQTNALSNACSLSCTSANSLSGSEPATIPAPA